MENSSSKNKIDENNIFILKTANSEAVLNKNKIISLSFKINDKKINIISNNHDKKSFLLDGSYIMFPWVGRIENDKYLKDLYPNFSLNYPFRESNNFPLHGFFANHPREVVSKTENSIIFKMEETNLTKILYKFYPEITEKYSLFENKILFSLEFINQSENLQYFNFGYHPYFHFDLENISRFHLDSSLINKKWELDKKLLIPIIDTKDKDGYSIKKSDFIFDKTIIQDNKFDNLYEIEDDLKLIKEKGNCIKLIKLINEDNKLEIELSTDVSDYSDEEFIFLKFIQIYTPDERNRIAIEPMSGPSNSFNLPDLNYNIKIKPKEKKHSNFQIELKTIS